MEVHIAIGKRNYDNAASELHNIETTHKKALSMVSKMAYDGWVEVTYHFNDYSIARSCYTFWPGAE